ncbi:MAG: hypothetical protein AAF560_33790, partial [Acidobacteriota bacterium]
MSRVDWRRAVRGSRTERTGRIVRGVRAGLGGRIVRGAEVPRAVMKAQAGRGAPAGGVGPGRRAGGGVGL